MITKHGQASGLFNMDPHAHSLFIKFTSVEPKWMWEL